MANFEGGSANRDKRVEKKPSLTIKPKGPAIAMAFLAAFTAGHMTGRNSETGPKGVEQGQQLKNPLAEFEYQGEYDSGGYESFDGDSYAYEPNSIGAYRRFFDAFVNMGKEAPDTPEGRTAVRTAAEAYLKDVVSSFTKDDRPLEGGYVSVSLPTEAELLADLILGLVEEAKKETPDMSAVGLGVAIQELRRMVEERGAK